MRLKVLGWALVVAAVLLAVLALAGLPQADEPGDVLIGTAILVLPVLVAGVWLVRRPDAGTRGPSPSKTLVAAATALLVAVLVAVTAAAGEWTVAGSFAIVAAGLAGYAVLTRDSAEDDVVATVIDLPTGPERGLLIVSPRSKRLVYVIVFPVVAAGLTAVVVNMRADGDVRWWFMGAVAALLLAATPVMFHHARGTSGLGLTVSGVSFTGRGRTVLVPWRALDAAVVHEMGRGTRMIGLVVNDPSAVMGTSDRARRAVARNGDWFGVGLSYPATSFDLHRDRIVELVEACRTDPDVRASLPTATGAPGPGAPPGTATA